MWNEARNTIFLLLFFTAESFQRYPCRLFLLMISIESSQGWDSLRLADRSVCIDKCQHSFSFDSLCHSEVVIWTFYIFIIFF